MTAPPDLRPAWRGLPGNAAWVLAARLLVPALNVALVVVIARRVGVEALGQYTLLITLFVLLETAKSCGLPALLMREVAREGDAALAHYPALVRIGVIGAVVASVVLVGIGIARGASSAAFPAAAAVIALGLFPSAWSLANDALFLALGHARLSALVALVENLTRLLASLAAVIWLHRGLVALAAIYAATRLLGAVAGVIVSRRVLGLRLPEQDPAVTRAMVRQIPHFLGIYVLPLLLFRMDVILLGLLAGDFAVGVYSAAMRVITVGLVLPDSFFTASFPVLSRLAGGERAGLERFLQRIVRVTAILLTPVAAGAALLAPTVIRVLYGPGFAASVPVLQTLVWFGVPFALCRAMGDSLVACGREALVFRVNLATLVLSTVLYLVFVPRGGAPGAALAFLLSALVMLGLLAAAAWRGASPIRPPLVGAALAPAALTVLAVIGTGYATGLGAGARFALVIAVCGAGVGALALPEWREMRRRNAPAVG